MDEVKIGRRTFLRRLALAAIAGPALVKAAMEAEPAVAIAPPPEAYWSAPAIGALSVLTVEMLDNMMAKAIRDFWEPDLIIVSPSLYRRFKFIRGPAIPRPQSILSYMSGAAR
jgi:hypothetical protein